MPLLAGALELAAAGVITGADRTNREYVGDDIEIDESVSKEMRRLLYDPQTAGGMLIAIAEDRAPALLSRLRESYPSTRVIGRAIQKGTKSIIIGVEEIMTEPNLKSTEQALIVKERATKEIVVGVPHHAPAGTPTLPCKTHPDSDENAGFLGHYLANILDCHSVIACNATEDVNKSLESDYAKQIAKWKPKFLIEVHGHGGKKAKFDVEISSGKANNEYSKQMAERIGQILQDKPELEAFSVGGDYSKLTFQAKKAVTISDERWVSYHIELPPALRKVSGSLDPPVSGYHFCDAIAQAIKEIHLSG